MMLLISLLPILVTGDLLTKPLPRQHGSRSLNDVVYRKYQKGDDMSLMGPDFYCEDYRCWVAATSGDRKVVGVVEMLIPRKNTPADVKAAIDAKRPPHSKKRPGGIIGYILNVHVAEAWRNKKVGSKLLPQVFRDLPGDYPKWDVVYLRVNRANNYAIRLYENTEFIKIIDIPGDPMLTYARYNLS